MIYIYSAEQTIRINPQISRIPNKRESQGSEEIIYPVIGRSMFGCCAYLTYRPAFICLELAHIMKFPPPFFTRNLYQWCKYLMSYVFKILKVNMEFKTVFFQL